MLTKKQEELFDTIKDFIEEYGYSPSIRELAKLNGNKSPATIYQSLKILKNKGYINYIESKSRTIRVLK